MSMSTSLDLQPLGDHFAPPTEAYMSALERELGARLPTEYRTFLAQYGVCACTDYTSFTLPGGLRVDLNVFLGSDPDDSYDVLETWRGLADRLPPQLLPFAFDPFGSAVCIDVSESNYGRIHFWDHESELLVFVARGFNKFMAMLERETA